MTQSVARGLPYSRTLDYCSIAYFVAEADARRNMREVLRRLSRVSEEEARHKIRALRRVREAFVFRQRRTASSPPDAADYILSEACALASEGRDRFPTPVGGTHSRCQLTL